MTCSQRGTTFLDITNQPLRRHKELGNSVHDTFERFWKSKDCNDVGWLLLTLLDKVARAKDELRDSISKLRRHRHDLGAPRCALRESLISCSCRAEVPENQMLVVLLKLAESQSELNSQQYLLLK